MGFSGIILTAVGFILMSLTCTFATEPNICEGKTADIVVLFDSSNSISDKDYNMEQRFLERFVALRQTDFDKNTIRMALIQFGTQARSEWGLTAFPSAYQLRDAIAKLNRLAGTKTSTGAALEMLKNQIFVGRTAVPKIGLVITDGGSQDTYSTRNEAKITKAKGVKLIVVAVGQEANLPENMEEINAIASGPDYIIKVENYSALANDENILNRILGKLCPPGPPGPIIEDCKILGRRIEEMCVRSRTCTSPEQ